MANYTIIGGDGKEYGPVTETDIRQWIAEGRLNAQSSAKGEGDAEFRALGLYPELAGFFGSTPPALAPSGNLAGEDWRQQVLSRAPELRLGECLAAGGSFLAANAGFVIGAVFLAWLANFGLALLALSVPLLGALVTLCLNAVIMGGLYVTCLRKMRGEAVSPTAVFCGFSNNFLQLLLVGVVSMLLMEFGFCCFILPGIYLAIAWILTVPLVADRNLSFWPAMELSRKVVTRVWFEMFVLILVAYLPVVLLQIYSGVQMFDFFISLYHQAGGDMTQFSKLMQGSNDALQTMSWKMMFLGQGVMLVNLFYAVGVLMRAYENLFGPRKS